VSVAGLAADPIEKISEMLNQSKIELWNFPSSKRLLVARALVAFGPPEAGKRPARVTFAFSRSALRSAGCQP